MALNFCVVSIHSCPGEKIGLNKAGGLNIYVINLVNFLSTNHNVYLITKDCDNCEMNFLESNVNVIHCDPKDYNPKNVLPNFDVIISNYWTSGIFCKLNLSKSNAVKINISHTLEYLKKQHISGYKVDSARVKVEKENFDFFDYTLSFSDLESKLLTDKYHVPSQKIIESTPGFSRDLFFPEAITVARKKIDFDRDGKLILFVGRNDYLKGIDIAIDAFQKIYNEFESITLGIVGGDYGSDSQKLMEKKHSKFLYSKDIKWFGSVPHDELRNYYNASNLVIIPSRSETFGLVCLEALACETPVLFSDTGRMRDFVHIGKTGMISEDTNSDSFSTNIREFIKNEKTFIFQDHYYEKIRKFEWNLIFKKLTSKLIK